MLDWLPSVRSVAPAFVDRVLEGYACERRQATAGDPCAVPPPPGMVEPLSERELEVLGLVAQGLSNRQIGERLYITVGTVKTHVHHILGKLGVERRAEAAARARELGLV
jgi:LuxR family maltose regulon positive regulatory protein